MTTTGVEIVYLSHGAGPLPVLGDRRHRAMVEFMSSPSGRLRRPDAILVISAHWEERAATLLGAQAPPLFYDYYGFSPEAYSLTYPAPGDPDLAYRIADLLKEDDVPVRVDTERGFDHGLFIPLKTMYPEADIPCTQMSLIRGLDPAAHLALGEALRGLKQDNVLVIGSGFSFHNVEAFEWHDDPSPDSANDAFQDWLIETCAGPLSQLERERRLTRWEEAPSARYCHPREEHLLPLHVCAGLASASGETVFDDYVLGKRAVAFRW